MPERQCILLNCTFIFRIFRSMLLLSSLHLLFFDKIFDACIQFHQSFSLSLRSRNPCAKQQGHCGIIYANLLPNQMPSISFYPVVFIGLSSFVIWLYLCFGAYQSSVTLPRSVGNLPSPAFPISSAKQQVYCGITCVNLLLNWTLSISFYPFVFIGLSSIG